jgi:heme/copper-type cytochrome/quinol oxidase subunit 1
MLGLAIIAALAVGVMFLMIRVKRRAPGSQPVAYPSFARSRGGLLLSAAIPIGAFALQAIFGQFWLGLAWILLGSALGLSLELSSKRRIHRPPA